MVNLHNFPTNLHICLFHDTKANYYKYKLVCLPLNDFFSFKLSVNLIKGPMFLKLQV